MSVRELLERRLLEIPKLSQRPSRRGHGSTYFAGDHEVAHFHGEERIDVRLTRGRIHPTGSVREFDKRVTTRGPSADWVAVRIEEVQDVPLALSLVKEAIETSLRDPDDRDSTEAG
jgi:hypothetical protein